MGSRSAWWLQIQSQEKLPRPSDAEARSVRGLERDRGDVGEHEARTRRAGASGASLGDEALAAGLRTLPRGGRARLVDDERVLLREADVDLPSVAPRAGGGYRSPRTGTPARYVVYHDPQPRRALAYDPQHLGGPRRVPEPVTGNVDGEHLLAPAAGRGPRQRAASGAGFTPAKQRGAWRWPVAAASSNRRRAERDSLPRSERGVRGCGAPLAARPLSNRRRAERDSLPRSERGCRGRTGAPAAPPLLSSRRRAERDSLPRRERGVRGVRARQPTGTAPQHPGSEATGGARSGIHSRAARWG